jgi:uncharacterized protein (TIGR02679 family)
MISPYLRSPHLAVLWKEAHRRLSTGTAVTAIRLRGLNEDERHALAELLGIDGLPAADARITIAALRESLDPVTLEAVLTELVGPVDDQSARRREAAAEREGLWDWLEAHPLLKARPALQAWAVRLRGEPLLGTVTETRDLIARALAVIEALPAQRLPLPVLAQRTLGDPHSLDTGRLPALVLRAIAAETGRPDPLDAEQRRAVWEAAGVVCDELSSTVLVAGLAPEGDSFLAATLHAAKGEGEAVAVTLGQLRRSRITFASDTTAVSVVENPSVMQSALDRFGTALPPLVCVSGRLHVAARTLLRTLAVAGCDLRYHGDFDPAGISIATDVVGNFGARPWRMGNADYLEALVPGPVIDSALVPPTPWDVTLQEVMRREGFAVYEAAVIETLLEDLRQ